VATTTQAAVHPTALGGRRLRSVCDGATTRATTGPHRRPVGQDAATKPSQPRSAARTGPTVAGSQAAGQGPSPQQFGHSYADRIRFADLLPARKREPSGGWRWLVFKASFGLINPGPSTEEIRQSELEDKIRSVVRGHYKVGVMGKGGVGKTTVAASLGSVFAEVRQDDRVVAVDADTSFGKLGSISAPPTESPSPFTTSPPSKAPSMKRTQT
jgi:hypothetical protein